MMVSVCFSAASASANLPWHSEPHRARSTPTPSQDCLDAALRCMRQRFSGDSLGFGVLELDNLHASHCAGRCSAVSANSSPGNLAASASASLSTGSICPFAFAGVALLNQAPLQGPQRPDNRPALNPACSVDSQGPSQIRFALLNWDGFRRVGPGMIDKDVGILFVFVPVDPAAQHQRALQVLSGLFHAGPGRRMRLPIVACRSAAAAGWSANFSSRLAAKSSMSCWTV